MCLDVFKHNSQVIKHFQLQQICLVFEFMHVKRIILVKQNNNIFATVLEGYIDYMIHLCMTSFQENIFDDSNKNIFNIFSFKFHRRI
jgi:hypothetical protein